MRKYICPNCGDKCLDWNSGIQNQNYKSPVKLPPRQCPNCNTYISSRIELRATNANDRILDLIFKSLLILELTPFFLLVSLAFFDKKIPNLIPANYYLFWGLTVLVTILIAFVLQKEKPKKRIFAVVDESFNPLYINPDLKVTLNTIDYRKPNIIFYDYTTYDFTLQDSKKSYPVIIKIVMLHYEIKYYELTFLGKHSNIIPPLINLNDSFTLTDYLGNSVKGIVEGIFDSKI